MNSHVLSLTSLEKKFAFSEAGVNTLIIYFRSYSTKLLLFYDSLVSMSFRQNRDISICCELCLEPSYNGQSLLNTNLISLKIVRSEKSNDLFQLIHVVVSLFPSVASYGIRSGIRPSIPNP